MEAVIGVLAGAAAIFFLALWIPADLVVNVETSAANRIRVRLVWLFGLLDVNVSGRKPRRKRPAQERQRRGRPLAFGRVRAALVTRGLPAAVARLLRRILRAVKMREFRLSLRLGFDDPSDTGMLFAAAAPLIWLLRAWSADGFSAQADFEEEIFSASGNMDVRVYPVRIVAASALFLLSPATLRGAKAVLVNR